jgi:hypothetical protein
VSRDVLEAEVASGGVVSVGSTKQPVVAAAVKEIRLQRVALVKILEGLAVPEEAETPSQSRARKAATSHWNQRRDVRQRRG